MSPVRGLGPVHTQSRWQGPSSQSSLLPKPAYNVTRVRGGVPPRRTDGIQRVVTTDSSAWWSRWSPRPVRRQTCQNEFAGHDDRAAMTSTTRRPASSRTSARLVHRVPRRRAPAHLDARTPTWPLPDASDVGTSGKVPDPLDAASLGGTRPRCRRLNYVSFRPNRRASDTTRVRETGNFTGSKRPLCGGGRRPRSRDATASDTRRVPVRRLFIATLATATFSSRWVVTLAPTPVPPPSVSSALVDPLAAPERAGSSIDNSCLLGHRHHVGRTTPPLSAET